MIQSTPFRIKYLFILLLSSFFIFSCSSDINTTASSSTDGNEFNLNGKVKSFRSTKFLAIDNFSVIVNGKENKFLYIEEYLFNLDGSKIERNDYLPDGTHTTRTTYLYKNNRLAEHNNYDAQGVLYGIGSYEYNDDNKLIKLMDKTTDGRINWTKSYQYDSNGNLIETNRSKIKNIIETEEKFSYDEKGNVIESNYFKSKEFISKNVYKYNEDNDIVELTYGKGNIYTYKYKYDFKGNWIKKIVFLNKNPSGVLTRKIEYFD